MVRFVGLDLKRCWADKSGKDEEATETRNLSPVLEYQSTATMSFADDHPDLINFNEDNLHQPSFHAGLTLTEMLDPAFDHVWLNFDASKHYAANDHVYNGTLFSDYLPLIPALSIVHGSTEIPEEPLFDDAEYRRNSLQSIAPNDLADDGIAIALPSHIAVTHSPEASAASLLNGSADHPPSKALSQPGPASALFSDGGGSASGSQHEWHPADPVNHPHVASTTTPSTQPVYSQLYASPSSSSSLLTPAQQASYDTQSSGTPDEGLGITVKEPGARNLPGENHFDQFNFIGSTYNGAAVDQPCLSMIAATPIGGGLASQLRSLEQVDSVQDFLYPASSQRLSELTGFDGRGSLGQHESLDGQHSALRHNHRLPDKHVRRYTGVELPAVALEAQQSISQKYHLHQYPYDQPETQRWSSPGSGNQNQLGSYNEYLLRSQASTHDWRSHHLLPESGYPLPASGDTSVLMSDSECPPICEPLPPKRSSLAQRRTRKLAILDTKPYSRQNPICSGMARRRKADVFNPARPIHCRLRVDRGDRKGQKCNVWCDGVDAFTKHLKDDGHNFSPCKVPLSKRPGPDYAPDDDGRPMEWGFCTWDEDNDCETFKMRRRKNRLDPMSGGDLIRHIREAHAGVPR